MLKELTFSLKNFAHEVYVLNPGEISHDESLQNINPWSVLANNQELTLFFLFAIGIGLSLIAAAFLKRTSFFQKIGAKIDKATVIAPDIIRIVFGGALMFSAQHNALFGPELPLSSFPFGDVLRVVLLIIGFFIIIGFRARAFSAVALAIWLLALFTKGWYMLTYANYLAEAIAVMLFPVQTLTLDRKIHQWRHKKIPKPSFEKYSMPITRIGFALALFYTAIAVKFLQASLPLDVVNSYDLTRFFPFSPLFVVLGAGLVEILIAVLYFAGFLRRITTVIFVSFVTMSIIFFQEAVWPHYLLFALGIGIFLHKPDVYALDKYWFNGKKKPSRKKSKSVKTAKKRTK